MPKSRNLKVGVGKKNPKKAKNKREHYKNEAEANANAKAQEKLDNASKEDPKAKKDAIADEEQPISVQSGLDSNGAKGDDEPQLEPPSLRTESKTIFAREGTALKLRKEEEEEEEAVEEAMAGLNSIKAGKKEEGIKATLNPEGATATSAFKDRIAPVSAGNNNKSNGNGNGLSFAERTNIDKAVLPVTSVPGSITWGKPTDKKESYQRPALVCTERACIENPAAPVGKPGQEIDFSREANNNYYHKPAKKDKSGSPSKDVLLRRDGWVSGAQSLNRAGGGCNAAQNNGGSNNGVGNGNGHDQNGDGEREDGGEERVPGPPRDALAAYEHPLARTWVWYFFKPERLIPWNESWREICTFSTAEAFWRFWHWVKAPTTLANSQQYSMFEEGVMPSWEDPANVRGGRWIWEMSKDEKPNLNKYWLDLMLLVLGETLADEESMPLVKGVVVDIRSRNDRLSVWLGQCAPEDNVKQIGRQFKAAMEMNPRMDLPFMAHDDSLSRRGSTTRACFKV